MLGLSAGVLQLRKDTRNESFFVEGDPALTGYHELLRTFGSDEVVYVLVELPDGDAFAAPHLERLLALGTALRGLPGALELRSPLHSPILIDRAGTLEGVRVSDQPPRSEAERAAARARVLGYAPFRGRLIDASGRRVGFLVRLEAEAPHYGGGATGAAPWPWSSVAPPTTSPPAPTTSPPAPPPTREALVDALEAALRGGPWAAYPHAAVGTPLNTALFNRLLGRELTRNIVLGGVIAALVLLWLFRHPFPLLPPLLVLGGTLGASFGALGLCDRPITLLSSFLAPFVVCAAVADVMHVCARYREELRLGDGPAAAAGRAVRATWWPCLLTSLTTAAGFVALLSAPLAPVRDLGAGAALGTLLAFALTFAILPPLLPLWRQPPPEAAGAPERALEALLGLLRRRPRALALCGLALTAAVGAGATRLYVDHDFLAYLDPQEPLRRDITFVQERMGGAVAVEVVIDAGRPDGLASARLQRELAGFSAWLRGLDPIVRAVDAIDEPLAEISTLLGGPRGPARTDRAAAELLESLSLVDPELRARRVSTDAACTRVSVRMDVVGSARYEGVLARIEAEAARRFAGLAATRLSGGAYLLARMKEHILTTQRHSFAWAFAVVSLLLLAVARRPGLGLAAVLCNLAPLLVVLGAMGWLGVPLEVGNSLLATVALGIVVDDTIHMVCSLRAAEAEGATRAEALARTFRGTGRAVLFSSLLLGACFLSFQTSALSNVRSFGLLTAATFAAALAADLVLLPALLLFRRPA
ncbi:MAG: RND family transporter [Planctomycetota bacterium]